MTLKTNELEVQFLRTAYRLGYSLARNDDSAENQEEVEAWAEPKVAQAKAMFLAGLQDGFSDSMPDELSLRPSAHGNGQPLPSVYR
jgi:hypothetical protein